MNDEIDPLHDPNQLSSSFCHIKAWLCERRNNGRMWLITVGNASYEQQAEARALVAVTIPDDPGKNKHQMFIDLVQRKNRPSSSVEVEL